ncbi:MAG: GlsB/YeaQ/YmgE family stress response membrane protein [Bacteroidota bacterium]
MESIADGNIVKIVSMVLIGAVAGTLASRIMRGNDTGFIFNAVLGIAGAVVGGMIFDFFGWTPGSGIVRVVDETFGVRLPQNFVGTILSATIGAIIILWVFRIFRGKRR